MKLTLARIGWLGRAIVALVGAFVVALGAGLAFPSLTTTELWIGIGALAVVIDGRLTAQARKAPRCPHCRELAKYPDATVCSHCGRDVLYRLPPKCARSRGAVALRMLAIIVAAVAVFAIAGLAGAGVDGRLGAAIGALIADIAVMSFATLRAYPPSSKPPIPTMALASVLFTPLIPLLYLSWLWATQRKWEDASALGQI